MTTPEDRLAEAERYWRDISVRQVGSTRYWGLPLIMVEYDRRAGAEAVLRDIAAALRDPSDLSEVCAALLVEHGQERTTEIMAALAATVEKGSEGPS